MNQKIYLDISKLCFIIKNIIVIYNIDNNFDNFIPKY